jgi:GTP-binding protein
VLIHLVDVSGASGRDPVEDFDIVQRELALFDAALAAKPMLVAANKVDALDEPERVARLEQHVAGLGLPFFRISGVAGTGVPALLEAAWPAIAQARADEAAAVEIDADDAAAMAPLDERDHTRDADEDDDRRL